jgi:hypothetical protein
MCKECAKLADHWNVGAGFGEPKVTQTTVEGDSRISLGSACSPSGIEMMRPFSMPPVPTAPVMSIRPLSVSCRLLGSIRIQQGSGFSALGRTGQNNEHANNQGAE